MCMHTVYDEIMMLEEGTCGRPQRGQNCLESFTKNGPFAADCFNLALRKSGASVIV